MAGMTRSMPQRRVMLAACSHADMLTHSIASPKMIQKPDQTSLSCTREVNTRAGGTAGQC